MRTAPHNIMAEQSILGAMLIDNNTHYKIAQVLKEKHFYNETHKRIYSAIKGLFAAKKAIDIVTVSDHFENLNQLEEVGGFAYIGELAKNTPATANIKLIIVHIASPNFCIH